MYSGHLLSFVKEILYKANSVGIDVLLVNEAHTSKCSFLDNESVEHHDIYLGRRVSRGLFKASDGRIIKADVNGAYNILKKSFPKAILADRIEDVGLHPRCLK